MISQQSGNNSSSTGYYPIPVDTFQCSPQRPFDVFFQASDGNMVLYCAKGGMLGNSFDEKLKNDHFIERLFIRKRDKHSYERFVENNLPVFFSSDKLTEPRKAELAYETIRRCAEQTITSPTGDGIRQHSKVILSTMNHVLEKNESFRLLMGMMTFDYSLFNHSINVGILSMGLTAALMRSGVDISYENTVPAFFLHDIGKRSLPQEILNKEGPLSPVEWQLMRRHPVEGVVIMRKCGALTSEGKKIIHEHHERHDGSGYPQGLKDDQISLYAKICAIADVFDGLTSFRPHRKEHTTFAALSIMKNEMIREFDPRLFAQFVSLFSR